MNVDDEPVTGTYAPCEPVDTDVPVKLTTWLRSKLFEKTVVAKVAPTPLSATLAFGVLGSSETKLSVPLSDPVVAGLKVTGMAALPPAGTVSDEAESLKPAPVVVIVDRCKSTEPVLPTVAFNVCERETATLPKLSGLDTTMCG